MLNILERLNTFLASGQLRWLYLFGFSFLLSLFFTLVMRRIASRAKIFDFPNERKIHKEPIPLLGGVAIFIAYVGTVFLNFSFSLELKGIVIGGTIIFIIGLVDDIKSVPAFWKLAGQIAAVAVLIAFGVKLSFLPSHWLGVGGEVLLTVIWVIGITNAVNFFDGMDGLAAGTSAICALAFFGVAQITIQPYLAYLTIALAGSCLGFLIFNFKPASIFLGDAGSTFIGFTLAGIAVMGGWAEGNPKVALSLPILILGVFIFDMVYITISRIYRGRVRNFKEWIEYTGKDHLHHRLVGLGLNEPQAVLFIYLITACLGIVGINLKTSADLRVFLELIQAFFVLIIIVILMRAGRRLALNNRTDKKK